MVRPLVLALAVFLSAVARAAPEDRPKEAPTQGKAHAALQGSWRVLGPASSASLPLMLEFTFQVAEPTSEEMTAVFLTAPEQDKVFMARKKVAADPTAAEIVEMQAAFAALDAARVEITADAISAVSPEGETRLGYRVVRVEGITVAAEVTDPSGAVSEVLFTLPAPGLLMMGPPKDEPLVLRRR